MATDSKEPEDSVKLQRTLGLRSGISIIAGIIIGSGIFISPKGIFHEVGSLGLALIIWAVCGLFALFGALCYAELGVCIPISGGPYIYIQRAFGQLPAFLVLWINIIIRVPAGCTVIAMGFGYYIVEPFFPDCKQPDEAVKLFAAIVMCFLTVLNCVSVKWSSWVCDAFMLAKFLALILIIVTGIVQLFRGHAENLTNGFEGSTTNLGKIAIAIYIGMFSFSGWDAFNFVTEEIKNPRRNLPLAIWISVPAVTVIYVLANVSYFAILSPYEMLQSNAVAVTFGNKVFGVMAWCVPVFVAGSCFGSLNGCILTGSRMFFVGAREGQLPDCLALVNLRFLTPVTSVIFTGIMSLVFLFSNDIYTLLSFLEFTETLVLALPVLGLLYLRYTEPDLKREVKVNIIIPIIYMILSVFLLIFPWFTAPVESAIGLAFVLSGIPFYWFGVCWKNKPASIRNAISSVTIGLQKLFMAVESDKSFEKKLA
ncbi:large neutral amino acids transporter small subunit 1-like [Tubulanus polymorphus]|uniref:large neutral amino acids transporter small subunit 1-like n=1 Tax=Tubulanus polymorphus TaxID=672921 RepID=UPI003DA211F1